MKKFSIKKIKKCNADLVVVRTSKTSKIGSSEPCIDCSKLIKMCLIMGIKFKTMHSINGGKMVNYRGTSSHQCYAHHF